MTIILIILLVLFITIFPQYYVNKIISFYRNKKTSYPFNGFEFAVKLLQENQVREVRVLKSDLPDHYDPIEKVVKLNSVTYDGFDLSSLTISAHEVGHAIQDHRNYKPLKYRTSLAKFAIIFQKVGAIFMFASPALTLITKSPRIGMLSIFLAVLGFLSTSLINLITLPVELDASFDKALPIIQKTNVFKKEDHKASKQILRACAYTYLAASLSDLLNVWRWFAILRRR